MVNSELGAAAEPSAPYFVLSVWGAPPNVGAELAGDRAAAHARRFLMDWQRRCLPLPLCSAPSERVFDAYRHWCWLQDDAPTLPMNRFVSAALEGGCSKGRHVVRAIDAATVRQHVVLHPPCGAVLKPGRQLDQAAAAFAAALAGWKQATSKAENRPAKARK